MRSPKVGNQGGGTTFSSAFVDRRTILADCEGHQMIYVPEGVSSYRNPSSGWLRLSVFPPAVWLYGFLVGRHSDDNDVYISYFS